MSQYKTILLTLEGTPTDPTMMAFLSATLCSHLMLAASQDGGKAGPPKPYPIIKT